MRAVAAASLADQAGEAAGSGALTPAVGGALVVVAAVAWLATAVPGWVVGAGRVVRGPVARAARDLVVGGCWAGLAANGAVQVGTGQFLMVILPLFVVGWRAVAWRGGGATAAATAGLPVLAALLDFVLLAPPRAPAWAGALVAGLVAAATQAAVSRAVRRLACRSRTEGPRGSRKEAGA